MNGLNKKRVLLIITGSIAAYKCAYLVRLLIKRNAEVKVIMTPSATEFITPLSLSTLSKNKVCVNMMSSNEWNSHVEYGEWADVVLIAPATANTLAKMTSGIADNLALTTYLSAKSPVFVAPAMDLDMFQHFTVQENLTKLRSEGVHVIDPLEGELASGLWGLGKMQEPDFIVKELNDHFSTINSTFQSKNVLITAGPTLEKIDPVRFIGNRSTGKMGIELAKVFESSGAKVTLILGASALEPPANCNVVKVTSAAEMANETLSRADGMDILIFAAAVADYRPKKILKDKMKKDDEDITLKLERTTDIALEVSKSKKPGQITVGFALESSKGVEEAKAKMLKKSFDLIVLNSLKDEGAGFGLETNKVTIINKDNMIEEFELKSKEMVARDIVGVISKLI